jgi:hypothetical protein
VIEIELLEEKRARVNTAADILDVANADFYLLLNSSNILLSCQYGSAEIPVSSELAALVPSAGTSRPQPFGLKARVTQQARQRVSAQLTLPVVSR